MERHMKGVFFGATIADALLRSLLIMFSALISN